MIEVTWIDAGREPQNKPDPRYPNGIDIDLRKDDVAYCETPLPYPAKRCGMYVVKCEICGSNAVITTAGRPDDPKSVKIECHYKGTPLA